MICSTWNTFANDNAPFREVCTANIWKQKKKKIKKKKATPTHYAGEKSKVFVHFFFISGVAKKNEKTRRAWPCFFCRHSVHLRPFYLFFLPLKIFFFFSLQPVQGLKRSRNEMWSYGGWARRTEVSTSYVATCAISHNALIRHEKCNEAEQGST